MSYHRSRSIPSSSYGGTTIAADPTVAAEGGRTNNSSRRGRSRSITHASGGVAVAAREDRVVSSPSMISKSRSRGNSMSHRHSMSPTTEPSRRSGRSFAVGGEGSIRRRRRMSGFEGVRSISPSTGHQSKPKDFEGGPTTKGVALRRTMTAPEPLRSALKKSRSSDGLPTTTDTTVGSGGDGKQQSKTSLGILSIASGIMKDDHEHQKGSCPFPGIKRANTSLGLSNRLTNKKKVTFADDTKMDYSQHTSSTAASTSSSSSSCGSSISSSKSTVEESLRRMKDLQQKFRRSSQEGSTISEARLAKEIHLLSITPSLVSPPVPARNISCNTNTNNSNNNQERKTTKATQPPPAGRGKSTAAMSA